MRLLADLFKKLFVRLFILLVLAFVLITLEARDRSHDKAQKERERIDAELRDINKLIKRQDKKLAARVRAQSGLGRQITAQKNVAASGLAALEKSRKARRLRDKLPPWKAIEHLHTVVESNIKGMALSVNYADGTLEIININRKIAEHTVEKTRLYNELALVEPETTLDYLLKQDSFLPLLVRGDRLLLLMLSYMFFLLSQCVPLHRLRRKSGGSGPFRLSKEAHCLTLPNIFHRYRAPRLSLRCIFAMSNY